MLPLHLLVLVLFRCAAQPGTFLSSSASEGSHSNRYVSHPRMKWIIDSAGLECAPIDLSQSSDGLMAAEKQSGSSDSVVIRLMTDDSEPLDLSIQSTSTKATEQQPILENPIPQLSHPNVASNVKVEYSSSTSKRDSEMKPEKFKCSICCKTLANAQSLKYHCARFHGSGSVHECNTCNKKFAQRYDLRTHMRMHTNERPFRCHYCNRSFSYLGNLKQHLLTHTGEKPFECDVCNKKFAQRHDLRTHMRVHTNERPFSCHHCNRSFSQAASLKYHRLIHTGEKPYECDVCHLRFNHLSNCHKHYQAKHSGAKPFACNWCNGTYAVKQSLKLHQRKCKFANITAFENEIQENR